MKKVVLLIGLLVLIVALSGCVGIPDLQSGAAELQGKFKVDTGVLCDEFESLKGNTILPLETLLVSSCVEACGNKENYASSGCSGKWVVCYCEKDPAIIEKEKQEISAKEYQGETLSNVSRFCASIVTPENCGAVPITIGVTSSEYMYYFCEWDSQLNGCFPTYLCDGSLTKIDCENLQGELRKTVLGVDKIYHCHWFENYERQFKPNPFNYCGLTEGADD